MTMKCRTRPAAESPAVAPPKLPLQPRVDTPHTMPTPDPVGTEYGYSIPEIETAILAQHRKHIEDTMRIVRLEMVILAKVVISLYSFFLLGYCSLSMSHAPWLSRSGLRQLPCHLAAWNLIESLCLHKAKFFGALVGCDDTVQLPCGVGCPVPPGVLWEGIL